MPRRKETSPRVSSLSARLVRITGDEIIRRVEAGEADQLAAEIKSVAGSSLSQDVTPGQD